MLYLGFAFFVILFDFGINDKTEISLLYQSLKVNYYLLQRSDFPYKIDKRKSFISLKSDSIGFPWWRSG